VYRLYAPDGRFDEDALALVSETGAGTPLLVPVMRNGELLAPLPTLGASREHARRQLAGLPERLRSSDAANPYQVKISAAIRALAAEVDART
jgi:nicotinate phosphoribosyltransferase